ncbi:glycosyltransferase [Paraburkholderia bannensis]|uniref:glycosyltransferase n=1 Tax=Paraburkholderia bannensis TaxID=765414 RepID=UPI002AB0AC21|nr:glycosyltransferase [Paraburkholderia bannensis]
MNKFVLQRMMFPDARVCDINSMFFRSSARFDYAEQALIADGPAHIDLHAYFNIVPVKHFVDFMGVTRLHFEASFAGQAEFLLYFIQLGKAEPERIASRIVSSDGLHPETVFADLDANACTGYAYVVINSHSAHFRISGIDVCCYSERNVAKVGIVSCTFRREQNVLETAASITAAFDRYPDDFRDTELYVVDNDGGARLSIPEHTKLKHIKNANLGGAGGFTRGIIESIDCDKTHVLLCDDDILVFGEVVRRAVVALSLMTDPNMGLHGSMLELEFKSVLHEAGEYFDIEKKLHVNMHYGRKMDDLDCLKVAQLETIGTTRASNMFGWWFTAFPISIVKKIGLPLPLFVSGDDLEYSLRAYNAGYRALIAPYVSVWHPSHMTQQAPLRSYFISRNRLGYAPGHTSKRRLLNMFKTTLREARHMALTKRYSTADSMCAAMEDFMRGTAWMSEDLSDWLGRIRWGARERSAQLYSTEWLTPVDPVTHAKKESLSCWIIRKITFNGHLFTSSFHSPAKHPSSNFHKCLPFGVSPLGKTVERMALTASSILYYDPKGLVGYRVHHNNWMFWRVYWRILKLRVRIAFGLGGLYGKYRDAYPEVSTEKWWKQRLGI